jgi:hypothetical protein
MVDDLDESMLLEIGHEVLAEQLSLRPIRPLKRGKIESLKHGSDGGAVDKMEEHDLHSPELIVRLSPEGLLESGGVMLW